MEQFAWWWYSTATSCFKGRRVLIKPFSLFDSSLRLCQHYNDDIDYRSQIEVHTDASTNVDSARSSLVATRPSTNQGRRVITSVNVPLS